MVHGCVTLGKGAQISQPSDAIAKKSMSVRERERELRFEKTQKVGGAGAPTVSR